MEKRPLTIILDIDGCIFKHSGKLSSQIAQGKFVQQILPGVVERFNEWDSKGYRIILLTGSKESARDVTEEQLRSYNLFWDQLVMGVGGGKRVLINDLKPNSDEPTAIAVNLVRNQGLKEVDI